VAPYDSDDDQISGVSQQQAGHPSLSFTSQNGDVKDDEPEKVQALAAVGSFIRSASDLPAPPQAHRSSATYRRGELSRHRSQQRREQAGTSTMRLP
jgi:hypothetical protein